MGRFAKTAIFVACLAGILAAVYWLAIAAPGSLESETGSRASGANLVGDSSASGGQAVKFNSAEATCETNTPFVPGGPDPWGGCWPGESNTGVPDGTNLVSYAGSCTITSSGTTIDSRTVDCSPLVVRAANVTITNSRINGGINIESAYCGSASLTITDSHIDIPEEVTGGNSGSNGILRCNYHANRVNVTGGRRSMYCVSNCLIENSWVHEQGVDPQAEAHFSGIRMEQTTTIRHNSITCEATRSGPGSGCSAGLTGYGDFAEIRDNLIERNLFYRGGAGGSTMCAYGGSTPGKPYPLATNISFIGNRFVKGPNGHCGNSGTILHFNSSRPGHVWTDNMFDDGSPVNP